ncbi:MAG: hypothetical protein EOP90_07060 [Lysobacteraceae bacterium]|nr:MAG: hypothetical protein EOP90_07060 [Xanthomonadaceae bacterium]
MVERAAAKPAACNQMGFGMKALWSVALLLALAAMPVFAKDEAEPAVNANSQESFETVSAWVREQMSDGGRYSYVTASERTRVNQRLDQMSEIFRTTPAVDQMSDDVKMQMFNFQEEVNSILAKRDNERLVCKNVKPIGSNIPTRQCVTAGEIEARRRGDLQYLQRTQNSPQNQRG